MCNGSGRKQHRGDNEVRGSNARIAPKEADKGRESDERNDVLRARFEESGKAKGKKDLSKF